MLVEIVVITIVITIATYIAVTSIAGAIIVVTIIVITVIDVVVVVCGRQSGRNCEAILYVNEQYKHANQCYTADVISLM